MIIRYRYFALVVGLVWIGNFGGVARGEPELVFKDFDPTAIKIADVEPLRLGFGDISDKTGIFEEVSTSVTAVQTGAPGVGIPLTQTSRSPIGIGTREQLMSAAIQAGLQSGRFKVVERDPDVIVIGAVTEFLANKTAISGAIGQNQFSRVQRADPTVAPGTVISQMFTDSALGGFVQTGIISVEFLIYDTRREEYIGAFTIRDRPTSVGGALNHFANQTGIDLGYQNQASPAGRVKKCMDKAVHEIVRSAAYWRLGQSAPKNEVAQNDSPRQRRGAR